MIQTDVLADTEPFMRPIYPPFMRYLVLTFITGILFAACAPTPQAEAPDTPDPPTQTPEPQPTIRSEQTLPPEPTNPRYFDFEAYIPPQLIPPDGIRPIYEPRFLPAADAPLEDQELVIGISLEGEAKAYPITVLRFREMVNDELADLPILVTW